MDNIEMIIEAIRKGINPVTGEIFDVSILSEDPIISKEIIKLALTTQNSLTHKKQDSINALNRNAEDIFQELKEWRLVVACESGLPAYYVFSDKELWNIAKGDVIEKVDLMLIKGISYVKYSNYGDEIFEILEPHINEHAEIVAPNEDESKQKEEKKQPQKRTRHHKPLPVFTETELKHFPYAFESSIYISDIIRELNTMRNENKERAIKYKDISAWLNEEGYITETKNESGKTERYVTEKGAEAGFWNDIREGINGEYNVVLCRYGAQKLIVTNYHKIIGAESVQEDSVPDTIEKKIIFVQKDASQKEEKVTCKKCMLYKNETCFGEKEICEDFRNSVDISDEEISNWPKEMSGPYGTLHKYR